MREQVKVRVRRRSGDKTLSVVAMTKQKHQMYGKFIRKLKILAVHDEHNLFRSGDVIWIVRCKPHSKRKTWEALCEGSF